VNDVTQTHYCVMISLKRVANFIRLINGRKLMGGCEIVMLLYNLSVCLMVTPIDSEFCRFKIEIWGGGSIPMVLKLLPDRSWTVEKATMKFFTKNHIRELGELIEGERPEWFEFETR